MSVSVREEWGEGCRVGLVLLLETMRGVGVRGCEVYWLMGMTGRKYRKDRSHVFGDSKKLAVQDIHVYLERGGVKEHYSRTVKAHSITNKPNKKEARQKTGAWSIFSILKAA